MTNPAIEQNIIVLNEINEHAGYTNEERIAKFHWISDYADDIFETMLESENRRRPMYFLSSQVKERQSLIQLCQQMTNTFRLGRCAFHLSIYYLDRYMDSYTVSRDKLDLVALTCVHLAAQIESNEYRLPRYSDMNLNLVNKSYIGFEFRCVESKMLRFFDFELMRPTTASFVEMFAHQTITLEDYDSYCQVLNASEALSAAFPRIASFEEMMAAMAQLLLRISDYTLNVYRFGNVAPSLLAASCIAAARQVSGLPQVWTPHLTKLTSYTEEEIEDYFKVLVIIEEKMQMESLNSRICDSGFEDQLTTPKIQEDSVEGGKMKLLTLHLENRAHEFRTAVKRRNSQDVENPDVKRLKNDNDNLT